MKLKKCIGLVVATVLTMSILAGCGEKKETTISSTETNEKSETKETAETTGSSEETVISFVHWRSEDAEVYKKLISQFEEANAGIKVEMEVTSADQNQYYALLKSRLAGSTGVDVFTAHPGPYLLELQQSGQVMDLSNQEFASNYEEGLLESCKIDGKIYGLPQAYNLHAVFYNKDTFAKYNLEEPKTWDDLMNITSVLKENGESTMAAGFAEDWVYEITAMQLWGSVYKDNPECLKQLESGEVKFTDEKFKNLFQDNQDMAKAGVYMDDAAGTKYEPSIALFAQGQAAMLCTGTWSIGGIKQQNPDLNFGIFLMPSRSGSPRVQLAPAQAIVIGEHSQNKDAALKFVEYLSSVEGATLYAEATMQNSGVKGVKLEMLEMNLSTDIINNAVEPAVPCYHLSVSSQKLSDLWREGMVRTFLGEDIDIVTEEIQKVWDDMK